MSQNATELREPLPASVSELLELFPPMLIDSKRDFAKAQRIVDALAIRKKVTRPQARYLATLSLLIEEYEKRLDAEFEVRGDAVDVLHYLLEQNGMSGRDLGALLGQPQLGGKILRRERELSKAHIRTLSERFQVSADVFLRS